MLCDGVSTQHVVGWSASMEMGIDFSNETYVLSIFPHFHLFTLEVLHLELRMLQKLEEKGSKIFNLLQVI